MGRPRSKEVDDAAYTHRTRFFFISSVGAKYFRSYIKNVFWSIASARLTMNKNSSEIKAPIDNPENWVDEYGDFLYRYALSKVKDPSMMPLQMIPVTPVSLSNATRERIKKAIREVPH